MVRVPGTGALNEGHRFGGFAVGGPHDPARFGHLLHLDIGDHVFRQAVAQLGKLGGVVGLPPCRQHHGPHPQGLHVAANRDVGVQQPGLAIKFIQRRRGHHLDFGMILDFLDHLENHRLLESGVGIAGRRLPVHPGGEPAQLRLFLHQDHLVAVVGRLQGGA